MRAPEAALLGARIPDSWGPNCDQRYPGYYQDDSAQGVPRDPLQTPQHNVGKRHRDEGEGPRYGRDQNDGGLAQSQE